MIEPEMAFCDLEGDMEIAEGMIKYVLNYCMEQAPDELEFFNKFLDNGLLARLNNVVGTKHFKRVTYTQAIELLQKSGRKFDYPVFWGCDLSTEHERYITEEVRLPGVCNRLSQGDKILLYETESGRQNRGRSGSSGSGHRRDHRRLPARKTMRRSLPPA